MDMETNATPVQTAAQPPKKTRRVGTVAFALVLVVAGILLIVYQLVPGFDLMSIVKFSPALLVVLGIELLAYSAKPDIKVKFDWLAILGTAFILCVVGTTAVLPTFWNQYGPDRELAASRMEEEKISQFYTAMAADPAVKARIDNAYAGVCFNHATSENSYTLESGDRCQLNLTFSGEYADATAFAADCMSVMRTAEQAGLGFTRYEFSTSNEMDNANTYGLICDAAFPTGLTTEQLTQRVWTSYYYDGSSFSSESERDDYIREQMRGEIIDEYQNSHDFEDPSEEYVEEEINRRMTENDSIATPESAQM